MSHENKEMPVHELALTNGQEETGTSDKTNTASTPILPQHTPKYNGIVFPLLLQGEENATPTAELVRLIGCKSARELQNIVAAERERGLLILSTGRNGGGYFLPDTGEKGRREIEAFVRTLRSRAVNTLRALQVAKRELSKIEGQMSIESR